MSWIESHLTLGNHPKTRRLARELDISLPTAVGHLQYLWWWTFAYALDGDLSRFAAVEIAEGCLWEGDADAFVGALKEARFVDADGMVHDWQEYVARLKKATSAATLGNHRRWHEARGISDPDCPLCESGDIAPISPPDGRTDRPDIAPESGSESADLTRPDQTRPDPPDQTGPDLTEVQKARGSAAPSDVGTPLGEVIGSTPPPPAPGLSEVQDGLVKGLHESDPVWRKLTFGAVNKLNRAFGRPVVVMALQRCREEHVVPADPYPFVQAIATEIAEKAKVASG